MTFPLAITRCALLTPLDNPRAAPGEPATAWQAIRAGRRVELQTAVHDEWLDPDIRWDRSIRLALAVARQAAAGRNLGPDTTLFCGSSKGPVITMLAACEKLQRGEPLERNEAAHMVLGVGAMGMVLAQEFGIADGGTSVAACASGIHALYRATRALRRGTCARAIVVAADASLHPLFEGSFARLGILSQADERGVRHCEPFSPDETRDGAGFFVSEAAAALLIERSHALTEPPLAWLEECWIAGDGTALLSTDPAASALREGLAHCTAGAGRTDRMGFVHAHATGTAQDIHELRAIRAVVGEGPPVFSHKGFLGHSLGAAGLVGVALSVQCHRMGQTLPGARLERGCLSLTVAQGFGGHIGVAALRGA